MNRFTVPDWVIRNNNRTWRFVSNCISSMTRIQQAF